MKKIIALMIAIMMASVDMNCALPSAKKVKDAPIDSIVIILNKANAGDAEAQNVVGKWYYYGKDSIKPNYKWALQWWARSAKQEYPEAIANMAMCYQLGHGTSQDSTRAVNLFKKAIVKGSKDVIPMHEKLARAEKNVFSCLFLRECYLKGIGVKKDYRQASSYQELAAEGGHEQSQFAVGLNYLNNKQAEKAAEWFLKASNQGNAGATYYYGFLLLNGMGIAQDKAEGLKYFIKASEIGFPTADYQLGISYKDGNGIERDSVKAFEYIKKAACHGNADAKWMLGKMYKKGECVPINYYFAAQWLAEVALTTHKKQFNELLAEDNEGAFSQYLMGLRKYYVDKNYSEAIPFFTKVDKTKNPEGKAMLGLCYANKDNAKQNLKKVIKNLTKAADDGSAFALYHLSDMYEIGTGVKKDLKKAIELLEKAADAGVALAQCRLGDHYMTGNGVPMDLTKAAQLYLEAESQNHLTPQSAKNLIECYNKKVSLLPNLDNAEKRIEELKKVKSNNNLINLLSKLEK